MAATILEISGMRKAFGDFVVWRDGNLTLEEGETHAVIGGSGTGKSVLLKVVLGLLDPDQGSVRYRGQELVGMGEQERTRVIPEMG
ncbi:MAG TPA: ATP-binding cassette domain-containing protein, partial [Gammaproteobacteria bacterium]|nr:ATP-binding cassette domain-containing protein [Gammaproteobacteria bacterium]